MKHLISLTLLVLIISCKNKKDEIHGNENWEIIDSKVDSTCNLYLMNFTNGNYMFRLASSGRCQSLTKEFYTTKYQQIVEENGDKIHIKEGKIIFEYYSLKPDSIFIHNILKITENYFKGKGRIIENSSEKLEIELVKS